MPRSLTECDAESRYSRSTSIKRPSGKRWKGQLSASCVGSEVPYAGITKYLPRFARKGSKAEIALAIEDARTSSKSGYCLHAWRARGSNWVSRAKAHSWTRSGHRLLRQGYGMRYRLTVVPPSGRHRYRGAGVAIERALQDSLWRRLFAQPHFRRGRPDGRSAPRQRLPLPASSDMFCKMVRKSLRAFGYCP